MPQLFPDLSGNNPFRNIVVNDPKTQPIGYQSYILAGNPDAGVGITLAAGERSTPVYGVRAGAYTFDAIFAGTTPSLQLQYLDANNVWYNVDLARTASGVGTGGITIGQDSTLALLNSGANSITNLIAGLS